MSTLLVFGLINLVVALLWLGIVAWLIGRVLTDRFALSQWLWWIPTPAAIVAAALGFILAFRSARTRKRRIRRIRVWTVCGILLLAYFGIFEHRLLHATPAAPTGALTIAHWNMTLDDNSDVPALMRSIAALNADVLLLTSPPGAVNRMLHEQAEASDGHLHVLNSWPMLLVSRLPIVRSRVLIGVDRMFITQVELDANATLGRAIIVDLVDLPSGPRLSRMKIASDARRLLDAADAAKPDIAFGDFNITRDSASLDVLFPNTRDAFDKAGHGYGASFHRRFPLYHIDHILIREGSGLRAARYDILDEGLSRHCAQKAWIVAGQ